MRRKDKWITTLRKKEAEKPESYTTKIVGQVLLANPQVCP